MVNAILPLIKRSVAVKKRTRNIYTGKQRALMCERYFYWIRLIITNSSEGGMA